MVKCTRTDEFYQMHNKLSLAYKQIIMGKTAIILGATGLTGGWLLQQLIDDNRYDKIKLFSRSSCGIEHAKVEEHVIDLFDLKSQQQKFTGDVVFCCIGTTKAKTPD